MISRGRYQIYVLTWDVDRYITRSRRREIMRDKDDYIARNHVRASRATPNAPVMYP